MTPRLRPGHSHPGCFRGRLAVALLLLAAACAWPAAGHASGEAGVVLVFGDSLSAAYGFDLSKSWVSLLEKRLRERHGSYRVVNASISGETSRGGAARIEALMAAEQPDIVIVELGGNDGLRGIDVDTTRRNLGLIVDAALEDGAKVLLLAMELPPNYGQRYTQAFRDVYREIARRAGVTRVPFFLEGVAGDPELMQADGIHPEAEAQPRLLENVWPYLEPLLENAG